VAGGHSIDDPEPKCGIAVTGTADPAALLRIDAGQPGLPLTLTKPVGAGVVNAGHKATGKVSATAIKVMTTLNADASRQARAAGIGCATDVTGFGMLGHLFKLARASGVSAVIDRAAVPLIDGTRAAARALHVPGRAGETCNGCSRTPTPEAAGRGRPANQRGAAGGSAAAGAGGRR
jgi:selenide,water dikinase